MSVGDLPVEGPAGVESVVGEQIVVEIVLAAQRRDGGGDALPLPGPELLADATEQRPAGVLRPSVQQGFAVTGGLTRHAVAITAVMLVHPVHEDMLMERCRSLAVPEEILGPAVAQGEEIVVEVQELLVQAGDPVQEHFDGRRTEYRKKPFRDYVAVKDDSQLSSVRPFRHLAFT